MGSGPLVRRSAGFRSFGRSGLAGLKLQHLMKLPTMSVGIPYGSRRIVKEKQQLMKPSSFGGGCVSFTRAGVIAPDDGSSGLYRSTHDVRTAFWLESNATLPYF